MIVPFLVLDVSAQSTPISRDNVTGIGSLSASLFDITTIGAGKGSIDTDGKYTYAGGATISKSPTPSGHIYIPSNAIISSSAFVAADAGKVCAKGQVIPSDFSASVALPAGVSNITAYGFGSSNADSCVMSPVELGKQQRDVDKVLQIVLYDQAGKHGYFYDRARNITTAQYIAPCDDGNNFDNATKMLLNNVKMCYADVGTDLVIYTTVMQFYGANETPIVPPSISRDNVIGIGSFADSTFDITTIGSGKGSIDAAGKYSYAGGLTRSKSPTQSGHIYIPSNTIISSSAFVTADAGKVCARGQVIPSDYGSLSILPSGVSNITAYGFGGVNAPGSSCVMSSTDLGKRQRDVNNVLHVVLYDQAGKHGYSYSRSQNINTAQYIAACNTTNFDDATKALRNNVKMCYADVGTDLVIYTTVMQFYGATETPLDSPTPDPTDPLPPPGTIKIPPPDGFPTTFRSDHIVFTISAASNDAQMTTPKADVRGQTDSYDFGDIFVQNGTRIVSNPGITSNGTCNFVVGSIYGLVWLNRLNTYPLPTNVQPNLANGTRAAIDEIVTVGFHEKSGCTSLLHDSADPPLITDKELRVTIYGEYDKKPYFFSKRANMTEAQQIPACAADNFDEITLKLKDDTKMCAGVNGTNMVIITKRFTGFYGAADTITAPATPIDLDAGGPPDPAPTTPTPSALLTLAPPTIYSSSPNYEAISIISSAGNTTGYTSHRNNVTTFTHTSDPSTAIGDLFLVHHVPILSNPFFSGVTDESKPCAALLDTLATVPSRLVPNFAVPDNITPNTKTSLVGLGLDFRNGTGGEPACSPDPEAVASNPLITGKELRFTLYDQSDKSPYYFSPRDNITQAQQIPVCSSTNLDTADQTLKGDNSMCYGEHGDHMVIITKRLVGFYGAADTVTPPTNPVDLTIGAPSPDPSTPVTPDPTDPPLPAGTIKIPPPSGFPSGEPGGKVMRLADFSQNVEKQTAQYNPYAFPEPGDDSIKRQVTVKPRVGEVFVPGKITLLTNPLVRTINLSFNCYDIPLTNLTNAITIPNIQPSEPIGLGYVFDDTALCKTVYNLISDYPVLTDKELRVTLYGKYDKTPYYFSPRDNMTQAQSIPACSSTNFNTNNQTLKGDTKMCHGVNGTNMVIITKRFGGFYGTADTVTTPTNPIDLDSAGPSLAVTTSKEDVSGIGTSTIFNITSGALGIGYVNTGLIDTHGKHTFAAAGTTQKGHIYISPNTILTVNPLSSPFKNSDIGKDCVRGHVTSTVHADHDLPDDISEGVAYGFAYTNGTDTCNYNSNTMARQFSVDTPFRIVLYDQAGKQAYSYLPAAGITTSQNIVECSSASFDDDPKIPIDSTTQCYEDVGDDLVIYSEVMQWYGAKTPSSGTTVDPPLPPGTIKIPPPDGFPTTFRSDHIIFATSAASNAAQMTTPKADVRGKSISYDFGDIFVQNGTRIVSNPGITNNGQCNFVVESIYRFIWSSVHSSYTTPTNVQPNLANGTRAAIDEIVAVGFHENSACKSLLHNPAAPPLITDKELRVTIYGEYDKKPYFFSKRANMTEAQQIPACSSTNYDSTTQTLKDDTKMCAGVNGTNMVIITKRFTGFYGAADTITAPASPIDLDAGGAPDPPPSTPTPTPGALLSLAPPTRYSDPYYVSIKILSNTSNTTGYTVDESTGSTTTYTHTPLPDNQKGDVFFSHPVPILSNPIFSGFNDQTTQCITNVRSLAEISSSLVPGFALPDGISSDTVMLGLDFSNSTDETFATPCSPDIETTSSNPLITSKELRYTLYNQSDKNPYYFSPRDSILAAQPIPACSSTNLDTTDQTLKGGNTMCYGEHGNHMVIITKRLAGFYGAADTVPTPVSPVNLTVDITPPVIQDSSDLLTISGTIPDPVFTSTAVISDAGVKTGYLITSSRDGHTFTHTNTLADRIGSIFVPYETRIPTNNIFTTARSECDLTPIDIKSALNNNYVSDLAIPDNIKPNKKKNLIALGFDMHNNSGYTVPCSPNLESNINPGPLLLDKALQFTLFGKSKKTPYYISPRDNITQAQQIPVCSSTNLNTADQTLKGATEMCYGKNGTDMVILTKRLAGFYGATDSVTAVSPPDSGTSLTISPANTSAAKYRVITIQSNDVETTGSFDRTGSYTNSPSNRIGDIYIPPNTKVLSNPVLYDSVSCTLAVNTLKDIPLKRIQDLKVPDNIKPKQKAKTFAMGLDIYQGDKVNQKCSPDLEEPSTYPLLTDKPLRFTIYDKSDKKPYYFSPRDDIKKAQPIPPCSSTNYDSAAQTLKGDTKMCYGVNGDNLVIMTKRLLGFYGAANSVDTPSEPIKLDTAGSPVLYRDRVFVLLPDNVPDPVLNTSSVVSDSGVKTGYIDPSTKITLTHTSTAADRIGDIYIPSNVKILNNTIFPSSPKMTCTMDVKTFKDSLDSSYVTGLAIPNNITPNKKADIVSLGFDFFNTSKDISCTPDLEAVSTDMLKLDKELRVTIYDKYDKKPYYISPRDNEIKALNIPKCTHENIHLSNQSLKDDTSMCYGTYETHMVIITKRLAGFYGTANTVDGKSANSVAENVYTSRDNIKGIGKEVPFEITTGSAKNATIETSGKYTYSPAGTTQKGHIYIPPSTTIFSDIFPTGDAGKVCVLGHVLSSEYTPSKNAELFTLPDDISNGVAYGFGYSSKEPKTTTGCILDGDKQVDPQLDVDNVLQIVLYDQANKQGYSYLRTAGITTSQYVPQCNFGNFDSTTKTLIGDNKHCYANVGKDLVIYTTIMQWYGAKPFDDDGMSTAPTFGTSPLTGEQLVTCGYKMDDTCRDITAYHVQYERDVIQTNTTHTFTLKALAPNMIDSFILAFGVPEIGSPVSAAEAYITAKLAVNYTSPSYYNIIDVIVHDPNNIIDYNITNTEVSRVSCSGGTLECAQVTFSDVLFRETLYHEPFVVMITDTLLYTSINYMNEGILVTGTPLNEQPTISPGITVDTGDTRPIKLVLVRTDKVNDLWADAFGNTWSRNSFGNYIIVQYAPYAGTVPVCDDINDRLCAPFKAKLDWHNQRMIELRDSLYPAYTTKEYAEIDNIFTYEFGDTDTRTRTLTNLGWLTE